MIVETVTAITLPIKIIGTLASCICLTSVWAPITDEGCTGKWSVEEEDQLKQIMDGVGAHLSWAEVSNKMGKSRRRQQCSQKWQVLSQLYWYLLNALTGSQSYARAVRIGPSIDIKEQKLQRARTWREPCLKYFAFMFVPYWQLRKDTNEPFWPPAPLLPALSDMV